MNKHVLVAALCALFVGAAQAEPRGLGDLPIDLKQIRDIDMIAPGAAFERTLKAGPSEAEVGDPDSFGRAKTYLGVKQTPFLSLVPDCTGFPPDSCIELNPAPALTSVDESDLAVFELPKKATNSILCFTFTQFATWNFSNFTGATQTARMQLRPRVRIESEVLDDPALINPSTGLPFGGVLDDIPITVERESKSIEPGQFETRSTSITRSCTGGLVNPRSLALNYGLSPAVISEFFKQPITLSLGVIGDVAMVEFVSFSVGARLYGD